MAMLDVIGIIQILVLKLRAKFLMYFNTHVMLYMSLVARKHVFRGSNMVKPGYRNRETRGIILFKIKLSRNAQADLILCWSLVKTVNSLSHDVAGLKCLRHEKTGFFLHMRKQRRRSASR